MLRGGDSAAHVDEGMLADCVVCWDNAASVVLQPCGHMCACSGCAGMFAETHRSCPMCRSEVITLVDILSV